MTILNDIWLTNIYADGDFGYDWAIDVIVGIIKARDNLTGEIFYYIGQCKGENIFADKQTILDFGIKYTEEQWKNFVNSI